MSSNMTSPFRRHGLLFVVSAPSGTGKTSLCQEIVSVVPGLRHSVSYTTRPPRATEVTGRDYHFVDRDAFVSMIDQNAFLEWAEVYGHLYGTPRGTLRQWREQGIDVLLDIDTQGAAQIRRQEPSAVSIYILPPSVGDLRRRLEDRRSDPSAEIAKRLKKAREEVKHYKDYQYVIVNDDFKDAVRFLEAIVWAERSRTAVLDLSSLERDLTALEEGF
jgi:guanylate kinase